MARGLRVLRTIQPWSEAFSRKRSDGARPGLVRRAFLALLDFFFTSTNRQMGEILARSGAPLEVVHDEPTVGTYRHILLRKRSW